MPKKNYVVTGMVKGFREEVSKPTTKALAIKRREGFRRDMKIAIPKYKWVSNLRIKKLKKVM